MLSRTADHLFWMSRYTERAENTARMLNVAYETSLLPQSDAVALAGWQGILSISELLPSYTALHGEVSGRAWIITRPPRAPISRARSTPARPRRGAR